jgi:orotidine-5'-phosphate decarboxylase
MPASFRNPIDSILKFCQIVIDATKQYACAYKFNLAFFEQFGSKGLRILEKALEYLGDNSTTIADGKRGDIGNSSKAYAKSLYESFNFDCATLNPFMGKDSLEPFFEDSNKLNFILLLTSNPGANDFQKITIEDKFFFQIMLEKTTSWFNCEQLGFVVGATKIEEFGIIRRSIPEHFILSPGVGTQGGDLQSLLKANDSLPLLVNITRDIIYSSNEDDLYQNIESRAKYYWEQLRIKL